MPKKTVPKTKPADEEKKKAKPELNAKPETKAKTKPTAEDEDWIIEDESDETDEDSWEDDDDEEKEEKGSKEPVKIKDLKFGMKNITVEAKIDFIGEGNLKGQGYGENIYVPAFIKDETGEIKCMFWNKDARKAKAGKKIRIIDAYVTQFRGELQLNANKKKGIEFL
jgi:hypothetical protein